MSQQFSFDSSYLNYYQNRLERAGDGTRVPGLEIIATLIERMQITKDQRVLDVGCSFGRLLPLLQPYSREIFGLELSYDVVDVAAREDYRCVVRGGAEDSNLPSGFFSHLVLFGVFDCCDQEAALREVRRLLVPGGRALITGKNSRYPVDDVLALVAERNAWRKKFPNSFTHAFRFSEMLPAFGLQLRHALRFQRRGHFGEMRALPAEVGSDAEFYEFAVIVEAGGPSVPVGGGAPVTVSAAISETARRVASARGFASVEALFESDHLDGARPA